ncbi:hypothetical protein [Mesorhizobium sp.]|uniref:hypothetical protein n=1 Tax=Mesorhizobium sp. TaxID=1871066 RepID=UPI0012283667|nr:hypothetical protein [Mesorhizobium sp.]TIL43918.1 MAG: hypothetical protein E5Y86_19580 [Mesorhizobium sp.]
MTIRIRLPGGTLKIKKKDELRLVVEQPASQQAARQPSLAVAIRPRLGASECWRSMMGRRSLMSEGIISFH